MNEDTYLKDNIKKCVDFAMSKDDKTKRKILTGMFEYNDYLLNEQLVTKVLNDEQKLEWFNNEMFELKDKEIERLNSIIKEVREYIVNNRDSDSFTELTSGKITDIAYCIPAFEDILEILKGSDKE